MHDQLPMGQPMAGTELIALRGDLGLTQNGIAQLLNVHVSNVSQWERHTRNKGVRKIPQAHADYLRDYYLKVKSAEAERLQMDEPLSISMSQPIPTDRLTEAAMVGYLGSLAGLGVGVWMALLVCWWSSFSGAALFFSALGLPSLLVLGNSLCRLSRRLRSSSAPMCSAQMIAGAAETSSYIDAEPLLAQPTLLERFKSSYPASGG
jgi:transcriptional regulator with XRE-family HTH domain